MFHAGLCTESNLRNLRNLRNASSIIVIYSYSSPRAKDAETNFYVYVTIPKWNLYILMKSLMKLSTIVFRCVYSFNVSTLTKMIVYISILHTYTHMYTFYNFISSYLCI